MNGKGLTLDTLVVTPTGYKQLKDISVGDYVIGRNGKPTKVLEVNDSENEDIYEFTFRYGVKVRCGGGQLWDINTSYRELTVTPPWFMEEDNERLLLAYGVHRYWLSYCEPVQFEHQNVPIDPYVMGTLIAKGLFDIEEEVTLNMLDKFVMSKVSARVDKDVSFYRIRYEPKYVMKPPWRSHKEDFTKKYLTEFGLMGKLRREVFIPKLYLINDIDTRINVMQGILDNYGTITSTTINLASVSPQLDLDMQFLVESLGGTCNIERALEGEGMPIICLPDPTMAFTIPRKKRKTHRRMLNKKRNIETIEQNGKERVRSLVVDNEDDTFLVEHFVIVRGGREKKEKTK